MVNIVVSPTTGRQEVEISTVAPPAGLFFGKKTVTAGTDEAIASTQALASGVTVKAEASNTGIIYVGAEGVAAATGFELAAGEQIFIAVSNLITVFIDTSVSTDGITYIGS